ncbi:MadC family VWA domain-containing protein [Tomitella biformata]|uniref:MadC family VWA domain-containing protein n=1 Tax=Tomitella biformata TaxID=630403 RepID=UPI000466E26E|nr:VWA domain-containing protein [Tomitella biformata]
MAAPAPDRLRVDRPARLLDVLAAIFGGLLRRAGVAASPAEVIEIRRVLALLGARERETLRSALRATCVKYAHENLGFDAAFDALFNPSPPAAPRDERIAQWAPNAEGLPTGLEIEEDPEAAGRYAGYDERFAEVGDELDLPDAEGGFNPHRDDDDVSLTGAQHELSVSAEADQGRRGVTYTVEVDRASTTTVGALSDGSGAVAVGTLNWDDPESILAWLDAYDASQVYGGDADDLGPLTEAQLQRLSEAIESFVAALAARSELAAEAPELAGGALEQDPHAQVELACHEILRRMRGAPRPRPREYGRGGLDMRRTVRASLRTEGVPFRLITRTPVPDRVRLLILADVSLSVRPITAFSLRLAQAMHRRAHRCQVLAFTDRPVDVTEVLLRGGGDDALARVLADERIDLEASSDYGRVLDEMLSSQAGALNKRTAVLIVGDGRSNGLPPKADQLAALRRRVHRLAWITPEPRKYWAQATCAMDEYADVCDRVVSARDPEQLLARAGELGHALS